MLLEQLSHAKVAIWGFGVEGQATSDYLQLRCPELNFTILCPSHELTEPDRPGIGFITDEVDAALLSQFDVVIKSPGISPYQDAVKEASCEFTSSTALWFSNEKSGCVIAITGTKGKSTSCAMLTAILENMEFNVVLAGNFGIPLILCLDTYDYVILETSSYQAYDGSIQAEVSVLLNLYPEHLNWHLTEQQYYHDKWRLLQHSDHVILNKQDKNTATQLQQNSIQAPVKFFLDQQGFYEMKHVLMYQDKALISQYGWQLKGVHNINNAAAICTVINLLNLDIKIAINTLKSFKALPHRLQEVKVQAGVVYIDDSISSTPHATLAALSTIAYHQTILLVGGFDRGVDWDWWVEAITDMPPKMIICSGANGKKIHQIILNHGIKTQCIWQPNLKSAVKMAQQQAISGDYVLLSPGAPSFDAFENYQHRGQQFEQWIK
ncbi:MAG: UDP-N-acetylmuramoyl-L-alanine--D-glutamate ligase [Marinicella sp.]